MIDALYNFFSDNGYVLELLLVFALFAGWMERRAHFWVRVAFVCAAGFAVSMAWNALVPQTGLTRSLCTVLFFCLSFGSVLLCFDTEPAQSLFYSTAASTAQHISYKTAGTLLMPLWAFLTNPPERLLALAYPVLYVLVCFVCYALCGRGLRSEGTAQAAWTPMSLFLLVGMQLCTNVFQNLLSGYPVGLEVYTILNLFDIISCSFLLALQYQFSRQENERQNNEILKHLLYQQKEQMQLSKENIELINIKCHDIKNQIAALGSRLPKEELDELTQAVNIYGSAPHTGNEALDVLLAGKLLQCENRRIRFDCSIDGRCLAFMKPADIYSLVGNAVDNAMEAVEQIADEERRCILAEGKQEKGMLLLHFENYYEGERSFLDGLPQTTKDDRRYHGFGMKSIRMICEKYGGYLSAKAENGLFSLDILLPLSAPQ